MSLDNPVNVLKGFDDELAELLEQEQIRQKKTINLIASENIASPYTACLVASTPTSNP